MRTSIFVFFLLSTLALSAQTFKWNTPQATTTAKETQMDETGYAVYYADYLAGNPTALGESYNPNLMTAAHPKLPLGTIVKITRVDNGLSTTVRINDRGAYCDECVIDLSLAAAKQIDLIRAGRTRVYLTVIGFSNTNPPTPSEFISYNQTKQHQLTARGIPANYSTTPAATAYRSTTASKPISYNQLPANYDRQPAQLQAKGAQPVAYNNQAAKPASEVPVLNSSVKGFAIQLGSYGQLSNAERHVLSLQNKGFDHVYISKETRADGSSINRVMVAPFTSMIEANQYLKDLRAYHNMNGIVVRVN